MARTVRDARLETRAARDRLAPGPTPHWKTLVPGKLHLGYRRKRKDEPGQWLVRHYLGGERYQKSALGLADDFQDAATDDSVLTYADAQRMAHAHTIARRASAKGATVADALDDYIKHVAAERPATAHEISQTAAASILPTLGAVKLADLTTEKIIDWRNALADVPTKSGDKRARRARVNRIMQGVLKPALNHAFKNRRVTDDLAWRHAAAFERVAAARPGFLTLAECKRLINAADERSGFRNLVRAALFTGCRYGELCALNVRDFHRGKIHIRTSKTGRPRDVVLTPEGVAFFESITVGRDGGDIMLPRRAWSRVGRWVKSVQQPPMAKACDAARIIPRVGFHQLRHTYASLSVMGDMPLMVLARNLGHASAKMVEQNYGHLTEHFFDRAVRASAPKFGFRADKKVISLK